MSAPFEQRAAPKMMSGEEYKAALAAIGETQTGFARWVGVSTPVGRIWAAKGPPNPVAKLLRLMVAIYAWPEWVDAKIEGRRVQARRKESP